MKRVVLVLSLLSLLLTACGRDPREQQERLVQAAEEGDTGLALELIDAGVPVDARDHCAFTPLMRAASAGRLELVDRLLAEGAAPDLVDKGGYSALMLAASNNQVETARRLLEAGAEIDRVERTNGWTALIWAAQRGHREMVALLLEHGADRTLLDHAEMNAIAHAAGAGHADIVELLAK